MLLPFGVLNNILYFGVATKGAQMLSMIISIIFIWPTLALAVKRLHDRNRSGWFSLIVLIPIIGPIWYLIEVGFLRGTIGPNRFGDDPVQELELQQAAKPESMLGSASRKGFYGRLVCGDISLVKMVFLYGVLTDILFIVATLVVLGGILLLLYYSQSGSHSPSQALAGWVLLILLTIHMVMYKANLLIDTWKSANGYRGPKKYIAWLAKIYVVLITAYYVRLGVLGVFKIIQSSY